MKSNASLFKNKAGSGRRSWEKWNENLYKRFPVNDESYRVFHDKCLALPRVLWNSIHMTATDAYVSLCSTANKAVLCFSDGATVHVGTLNSEVAFGRLEILGGEICAYLGDISGFVYVIQYSSTQSDVHLIARCRTPLSGAVNFIQPVPSDPHLANAMQMWAMVGTHLCLLSGTYSPPAFCARSSSDQCSIELKQTHHFQFAGLPTQSTLLNVQTLNTASSGAAALLAVHFVSSLVQPEDTSSVHVFIINAKQALSTVTEIAAPVACVIVQPTLAVPFISSSTAAAGGSSLFSLGRRSSSPTEVPIASIIEQSSVRSVGRGVAAVSFVVRVLGAEGTECAASFKTAQQRVLDILLRQGASGFAQSSSLSATSTGEGLLGNLCESIAFRPDGSVSRDLAPVALNAAANGDGELLWRACLRLQLLPRWRNTDVTAALQVVESTASQQTSAGATETAGSSSSSATTALSRLVLMEAAMSCGLAFLVAQYILAEDPDGVTDSGFLLSDVKRVYEWAVGGGQALGTKTLRSVQSGLEQATSVLCRRIVDGAVSSSTNAAGVEALRSELHFIRDAASGLKMVVEALLERKLRALDNQDHGNMSSVMLNVLEEGHTALRVQVQEVKCLMQTVSLLIEVVGTPALKFTSLLPSEVHQQAGGKVQSSSSSAAAYASMMSEYHLTVSDRLRFASQLRYLPEYLRAADSRLLDELCALLGDHAVYATQFLHHDSDSSLGVNLGNLSQSVATLFMLPLTALRAEAGKGAVVTAKELHQAQSFHELESSLTSKVNIAHSVVLYFLLDMLHLSASTGDSPRSADELRELVGRLGRASESPHTAQMGLLALWQVDAGVHVSDAVALICSKHTTVLQDQNILAAVVKRLLTSNHIAECSALLAHLQMSGHELVGTKFLVMATAAAISRADMWQYSWHGAKVLCGQLYAPGNEQHVLVKRELMHMLIQWALIHDEMGRLLDAVLDNEEKEEVELVLRDLAMADIELGRISSAAVDLCVAFLLRGTKFVEAMEVHERHAFTVTNAGQISLNTIQPGSEWATQLQALESRRMLIEAHASIPTISNENFQ